MERAADQWFGESGLTEDAPVLLVC